MWPMYNMVNVEDSLDNSFFLFESFSSSLVLICNGWFGAYLFFANCLWQLSLNIPFSLIINKQSVAWNMFCGEKHFTLCRVISVWSSTDVEQLQWFISAWSCHSELLCYVTSQDRVDSSACFQYTQEKYSYIATVHNYDWGQIHP